MPFINIYLHIYYYYYYYYYTGTGKISEDESVLLDPNQYFTIPHILCHAEVTVLSLPAAGSHKH
jgi:hypothetical protein